MKMLLDILLSNYFSIEPPREEVCEEPFIKAGVSSERPMDLMTVISSIMRENENLQIMKSELEALSTAPPEYMEGFMKKMISFFDSFERIMYLARQYPPSEEIDNWLKSVEMIYFRMNSTLEKYGLKALDTMGKPVNLDFHDVVEYRPTFDYPPDTVIHERQKGYFFNGKLLRDAKVVVAYNPKAG